MCDRHNHSITSRPVDTAVSAPRLPCCLFWMPSPCVQLALATGVATGVAMGLSHSAVLAQVVLPHKSTVLVFHHESAPWPAAWPQAPSRPTPAASRGGGVPRKRLARGVTQRGGAGLCARRRSTSTFQPWPYSCPAVQLYSCTVLDLVRWVVGASRIATHFLRISRSTTQVPNCVIKTAVAELRRILLLL